MSKASDIRKYLAEHGWREPTNRVAEALDATSQQVSNVKTQARLEGKFDPSVSTLKEVAALVDKLGSVAHVRIVLDVIEELRM